MIRFFGKLTAGHFRQHRLEALLCLIGVALGVAVVIAIDSAVAACVSSFGGAVQSLAERSTHSIFAAEGALTDEMYLDLLRRKLPVPLAPMIDRGVLAAAGNKPPVLSRLIGVDVFSERSLRSITRVQSSLDRDTFHRFLTEPGQVVLVDQLADRLGVKSGDAVQLTIGSRRVEAQVNGIIKPTGVARTQLADLMVADLATAQELTESIGRLDRIDTSLENAAQESELANALPAGLELRSTRQQTTSFAELIASYRLNLNALSLMASFVAVFIVYNSMLISVQQRLTSLGILRCLGGSRAQLAAIYLVEALLFSIVGGLLGVLAGWLLSRAMVGYVATTINDLYAAVRPGPVTLNAMAFVKGLAVSTSSCLLGALIPLYEASRTPPVNAFRTSARHDAARGSGRRLLLCGCVLLGLAGAVYFIPGRSPIAGFVMALLIALGFALTCPWFIRAASGMLDRGVRPMQLLPLQMAASGVGRSLGITGVAVAATMLAMSMNVGVRTMVFSFRGALGQWLGQRFAADVLIGPELLVRHKIDATLDPGVQAWVSRQPEVQKLFEYRAKPTRFRGKPIMLVGTDVAGLLKTLPMKKLPANAPPFEPAHDVLISEPLSGRTGLDVGDTFDIEAPAGVQQFRVYGIQYDFGSERGQIMLDRHTLARAWQDDRLSGLHIRLTKGADPAEVAARWSAALRPEFPVVVNSIEGVKAEVLTIFDRTFKVTDVLTWLAGGVAFCGLAGALLALSLARQRDYSVLAAVGMSARQTAAWVLAQGMLIAWTSAAVASVAGTALAYVLAYVIQYRSFGWSIPTQPQPRFWMQDFLLGTVAAVVAAIYPVYRIRSAPPAGNLRQE